MIVVVAVMGECCTRPHLKVVEVPNSGPDRAVTIAKRYLEFADEGWEPNDAIVVPDGEMEPPDYTVPENELIGWGLEPGDEVKWNDPDEGRCSRILKVKSVEFLGESAISIMEEDGSVVECYARELA
jgi:hypothetical protein